MLHSAPSSAQESDADVVRALDREVRDEVDEDLIVRAYLPWARTVAHRFTRRGVEDDDLDQVASMALVKALRRYDPSRGDFGPYATVTITGEIKRYFRDSAWSIRPPRRLQELGPAVETARRDLEQEHGSASTADIADRVGATSAEVAEVGRAGGMYRLRSTDHDDQGAHETGRLDPEVENTAAWLTVAVALRGLGERDRRILYLRFVRDFTQAEIGRELGLSQMQISRELSRLMEQVRHDVVA